MRKTLALLAIVIAAPSADAAEGFFTKYIGGPDGIPPCYARFYTPEHLAAHPKQKVTRFHLTRSEYGGGSSARSFDVAFGFRLKGSDDYFAAEAACTAKGDGAVCSVEGDGGQFRLAPRPDGLLVAVVERLGIEGMDSFSPNLYDSDDREFRLYASVPEDCMFDGFGGDGGDNESQGFEALTPTIERAD